MNVLLTNDDGVHADGLAAVREQLIEVGSVVVTIAPEEDCSGFARKSTFSRPVTVRMVTGGSHPVYACDGTPTDCVRVGLLGGLARATRLVVSGVNRGANLADDVTYSGTIGAGLEAAVLGTSGLCLSQQTPTGSFSVNYTEDLAALGLEYDFERAAVHGAALAVELMRTTLAKPVVLSVNYPSVLRDGKAVLTRPGVRRYPRVEDRPWGDNEVVRRMYLFGEPDEEIPEHDGDPGTDLAALRAGRVSVTPLSPAVTMDDPPVDLGAFLARVEAELPERPGFQAWATAAD